MIRQPRVTVYDGQLFRVEHQPIEGRELPYEFALRTGAVTMVPIMKTLSGIPWVLTIDNRRLYYGTSPASLPGGNIDGGHDNPDTAEETMKRELREEIGFGYREPSEHNMDIFRLRDASKTIEYPRFVGFMRDVVYLGNEDDNPAEVINLRPTPLEVYADELFRLQNGRIYPEVNAAISKAGRELGEEAVVAWLAGDQSVPGTAQVPQSFEPWLFAA